MARLELPPRTAPEFWAILAGIGSAALLMGALMFQYVGGFEPCVLCIMQRWPHGVAMLAAIWVALRHGQPDAILGLMLGLTATVVSIGLGGLHTGVEMGAWASPFGCGLPDWSDPNLAAQMSTTTPPDCSVPAWTFLGHSMAAFNTLFSCIFSGIWAGSIGRIIRTTRA